MERSVSYHIVIIRTHDGYTAVCPAFPHLTKKASSARAAYAQLKERITSHISHKLTLFELPPSDPVIQTKTLRLDLVYLREREELR